MSGREHASVLGCFHSFCVVFPWLSISVHSCLVENPWEGDISYPLYLKTSSEHSTLLVCHTYITLNSSGRHKTKQKNILKGKVCSLMLKYFFQSQIRQSSILSLWCCQYIALNRCVILGRDYLFGSCYFQYICIGREITHFPFKKVYNWCILTQSDYLTYNNSCCWFFYQIFKYICKVCNLSTFWFKTSFNALVTFCYTVIYIKKKLML